MDQFQKDMLCGGLVVGTVLAIASFLVVRDQQHATRQAPLVTPVEVRSVAPAAPAAPIQEVTEKAPAPVTPAPVEAPKPVDQRALKSPVLRPTRVAEVQPSQSVSEPEAREALGWVGADADAEQVWAAAINDPSLAANDRKNLIEDLNETGFEDPKNLTSDDLPIIQARLALIDELSPTAMDEVNAAAFAEARKDLVNMQARLVQ